MPHLKGVNIDAMYTDTMYFIMCIILFHISYGIRDFFQLFFIRGR